MKKIKALQPSLREKKRYVVFEILSKTKVQLFKNIAKAIQFSYKNLFGDIGLGSAGLIVLPDKYNSEFQRGIIKVNHKHLDHLRAALALIQEVEEQEVIVQSISASGILKKTETYLAA